MNEHHTCNAWCTASKHAHLVLISRGCTSQDDVLTHFAAPYAALRGRRILSARLAPEADREATIQAKIGIPGTSALGRQAILSRAQLEELQVWLIFYKDIRNEEGKA